MAVSSQGSPRTAPYGTWKSPIDADTLARGGRGLGFPAFTDAGQLCWVEARPAEGRSVLVLRRCSAEHVDLTPAPFNVRTRVHEYGGAAFVCVGDEFVFANFADQQLWRVSSESAPVRLTDASGWRFADMQYDVLRHRLIVVAERHTQDGAVENLLATVDLGSGQVREWITGRSFYAAPALSPDGMALAYLAWDHPHMPWDAAELHHVQLDEAGEVRHMQFLCGGICGAALQPTWSPAGVLHCALEVDQHWKLHRITPSQTAASYDRPVSRVECVLDLDAAFGGPLWNLGVRWWGFSDHVTIAGACFAHGRARLVQVNTSLRSWLPLMAGDESLFERYGHVAHWVVQGTRAAVVGASAKHGAELALVQLDTKGLADSSPAHRLANLEVIRRGIEFELDAGDLSLPEAITFPSGQADCAHGFFFRPQSTNYRAPEGSRPPLVVLAHGGPTGHSAPILSLLVQYFTTRGFAVLDVNYRGSTAYGRDYRQRLREQWGVFDVEDCASGACYLAQSGQVDPQQLFIRGGSAGGYTVLQALANHRIFAAGSCHYGISDLEALTRDTHKFESHYDSFLIGPYPEQRQRYIERSPIHYPQRIERPVVFFQGLEDEVVPANQTESMAHALTARGIHAEYHAFEGEQHGFRRAATISQVLESELRFFLYVMGLSADQVD